MDDAGGGRKLRLALFARFRARRAKPGKSARRTVGADALVPDRFDPSKERRTVAGFLVLVVRKVGVELQEEEVVRGEVAKVFFEDVGRDRDGGKVEGFERLLGVLRKIRGRRCRGLELYRVSSFPLRAHGLGEHAHLASASTLALLYYTSIASNKSFCCCRD